MTFKEWRLRGCRDPLCEIRAPHALGSICSGSDCRAEVAHYACADHGADRPKAFYCATCGKPMVHRVGEPNPTYAELRAENARLQAQLNQVELQRDACRINLDTADGALAVATAKADKYIHQCAELTEKLAEVKAALETAQTLNEYFRDAVGECHLMISRSTSEYQVRKAWEPTDLPPRLQKIMKALETARAEEREACCAALCPSCRNREPITGYRGDGTYYHGMGKICGASNLREFIRQRRTP